MAKKKARKKSPVRKASRKKAPRSGAAKRRPPRKPGAVPKGYRSVTPYLAVRDGAAALDFYQQVFGARKLMEFREDNGRLAHAELQLGDSHVMLAEQNLSLNFLAPTPGMASAMLYLPDVDAVVARAVAAGARIERPVADQFYGDRQGVIIDPFGHRWYVATHIEDVSPAEAERRMKALGS
ncbi:MAG TPA: VOC family protein [Gammaproteobacteria bacterium]|jgi:PhnB protein